MTSPDKEKHLHVEDDEEDDESQRRKDEEQISAFRAHDVLDMRHRL